MNVKNRCVGGRGFGLVTASQGTRRRAPVAGWQCEGKQDVPSAETSWGGCRSCRRRYRCRRRWCRWFCRRGSAGGGACVRFVLCCLSVRPSGNGALPPRFAIRSGSGSWGGEDRWQTIGTSVAGEPLPGRGIPSDEVHPSTAGQRFRRPLKSHLHVCLLVAFHTFLLLVRTGTNQSDSCHDNWKQKKADGSLSSPSSASFVRSGLSSTPFSPSCPSSCRW